MKLRLMMGAILLLWSGTAPAEPVSPSEVFAQVERIHRELDVLADHFGMKLPERKMGLYAPLKPRHVWQKSYMVLVGINILRQSQSMPRMTPNAIEPVLHVEPMLVYGQTQRILTELSIIKTHLGIDTMVEAPPVVPGKQPRDVFNRLHAITLDLEMLNQQPIDPPHVFAEVMRLYDDVADFMRQLGVDDDTHPPARLTNVLPVQSLQVAFEVMSEIQRLQRFVGIPHTNFNAFRQSGDVEPSDVFNMVGMALAEFQSLKAHYEVRRITPPAVQFQGKRPVDVYQLLQWIQRKLRLIDPDDLGE